MFEPNIIAGITWERVLSPDIIGAMIPILLILTGMVAVICSYWHKIAKVNSDNELKRDMLERGMSAEEIERVLNSGHNGKRSKNDN